MHQRLRSAGVAFFRGFSEVLLERGSTLRSIVRLTHRTGSPSRSGAKGFRSEFKESYFHRNMSAHLLIAVSFAEVLRSLYYVVFQRLTAV